MLQFDKHYFSKALEFLGQLELQTDKKIVMVNQIDPQDLSQVCFPDQLLESYEVLIAELSISLVNSDLTQLSTIMQKLFSNLKTIFQTLMYYANKVNKEKQLTKKPKIETTYEAAKPGEERKTLGGIQLDREIRNFKKKEKGNGMNNGQLILKEITYHDFKLLMYQVLVEQEYHIKEMLEEYQEEIEELEIFLEAKNYNKYEYSGADEILKELFENLKLKEISMRDDQTFMNFTDPEKDNQIIQQMYSEINNNQKRIVNKTIQIYIRKLREEKINLSKINKLKNKKLQKKSLDNKSKKQQFLNFKYDNSRNVIPLDQTSEEEKIKKITHQYKEYGINTEHQVEANKSSPITIPALKPPIISSSLPTSFTMNLNSLSHRKKGDNFAQEKQKNQILQKEVIVQREKLVENQEIVKQNERFRAFNKNLMKQIEDLTNDMEKKQCNINQLQGTATKGYYQLNVLLQLPIFDKKCTQELRQKYQRIFSNIKNIEKKLQDLKEYYKNKGKTQQFNLMMKSTINVGTNTRQNYRHQSNANEAISIREIEMIKEIAERQESIEGSLNKGNSLFKSSMKMRQKQKKLRDINKYERSQNVVTISDQDSNSFNKFNLKKTKSMKFKLNTSEEDFLLEDIKEKKKEISNFIKSFNNIQNNNLSEEKNEDHKDSKNKLKKEEKKEEKKDEKKEEKKQKQKKLKLKFNVNLGEQKIVKKQQQQVELEDKQVEVMQSYTEMYQNYKENIQLMKQQIIQKENKIKKLENGLIEMKKFLQQYQKLYQPSIFKFQEQTKKIKIIREMQIKKSLENTQLRRIVDTLRAKLYRLKHNSTITKNFSVQVNIFNISLLDNAYSYSKNTNLPQQNHQQLLPSSTQDSNLIRFAKYKTNFKNHFETNKSNKILFDKTLVNKTLDNNSLANIFNNKELISEQKCQKIIMPKLSQIRDRQNFLRKMYKKIKIMPVNKFPMFIQNQKSKKLTFESFRRFNQNLIKQHLMCNQKQICFHLLRFYRHLGFQLIDNRKYYQIKKKNIDKIQI